MEVRKMVKDIARRHGITQLHQFIKKDEYLFEAETINTANRVRVNIQTEQVYEYDRLQQLFKEV